MKAGELRRQSAAELEKELLSLQREQFNLRMQMATGQLTRNHQMRVARRNVARVKTVLGEMKSAGNTQ